MIIVSVWLTTPYFFLVSLGALQSIPAELTEAARVDGGGAWQIFRRVTLPLLLVAVAPLMIASFAFNFNNFNNVYLLTGGGPYTGASSIAGNTDILISYTYKLAVAAGKGNDYGLASAVAIIIFFIVAGDLRRFVPAHPVTGDHEMSEAELTPALPRAAVKPVAAEGQAPKMPAEVQGHVVAAHRRGHRDRLRVVPGRLRRLVRVQREQQPAVGARSSRRTYVRSTSAT